MMAIGPVAANHPILRAPVFGSLVETVPNLREELLQLQKSLRDLQARAANDSRIVGTCSFLLVSCRDAWVRLDDALPRNLALAIDDVHRLLARGHAYLRQTRSGTDEDTASGP